MVAIASGPSATPGSRVNVSPDQDQLGLLVGCQKLRDRQAVGDDLNAPADQGPSDFERGGAAVQKNGVAVFDQSGRGQADRAFFGGRRAGALVKGRHRANLAGVDGPAVRALDRAGQVERFEIAANRALGNVEPAHQLIQGRIALVSDHLEQAAAAMSREAYRPLRENIPTTRQYSSLSISFCQETSVEMVEFEGK